MKYIFETERLLARELIEEDYIPLSKVLSNPNSMKYYNAAFTENSVKDWIKKNIERYKVNGFGLWAIVRKIDNIFLGDCGITIQNIDGIDLPEVGFHIISDYCKNGYATEAAIKSIEYVNSKYGLKTIYSYCKKDNLPSQRVMQKIGMDYFKEYIKDGIISVVYKKRSD